MPKQPRMSLSSFSGLPAAEPESRSSEPPESQSSPAVEPAQQSPLPVAPLPLPPARLKKKAIQTEVPLELLAWLTETAALVRSNSTTPVPPRDRCYPQHLITIAIELLQASPVDWSQVSGTEDLRQRLNL